MAQDSHELPIFELPAVLLPGERMPLHIFEDRYKRMISRCLDAGEPFGIVLHDDEHGARSLGCSARVDEVLERFDDGRLNIIVSGVEPFRVLDRFEAPDYPAGEVELIDTATEDADPDPVAAVGAQDAFAALVERATGQRPDAEELAAAGSYDLAGRVELPLETKQELLELRSESERLQLLERSLRALIETVERAERIAERAAGNGRVRVRPGPGSE
jgi:Lon protease-like protein